MRRRIEFDKVDVQTRINELEKLGPLRNRGDLWTALAGHYGVSVATVAKWANGLEMKTLPGKKGGIGGDFGRDRGIKSTRKHLSPKAGLYIINNLPSYTTDQVRAKVVTLVEKAKEGNANADAQLWCLSCVNYQAPEMRECGQTNCCLYHRRPYKGKVKADAV